MTERLNCLDCDNVRQASLRLCTECINIRTKLVVCSRCNLSLTRASFFPIDPLSPVVCAQCRYWLSPPSRTNVKDAQEPPTKKTKREIILEKIAAGNEKAIADAIEDYMIENVKPGQKMIQIPHTFDFKTAIDELHRRKYTVWESGWIEFDRKTN